MSTNKNPKQWLTLKAASAHLAVHPTTLRRWSDNGEIPVLRTPGGHRRYAIADLDEFSRTKVQDNRLTPVAQAWAEQAIQRTRTEMTQATPPTWLDHVDDSKRIQHRELGRSLMGLTLQYIANRDKEEAVLLAEAQKLGEAYGQLAIDSQLPLLEALKATMFFRDQLIEVALRLPETTHIQPSANVRLTGRINQLMNTVQLAIASVY